jgi:hypothetical protein
MKTLEQSTSTAPDRIRLHYVSDLALNEEDTNIKKRYETAHALMLDEFETDKAIVSILVKRFDISVPQAYRDLLAAKNLYGGLRQQSKESMRYMVSQWAILIFKKSERTNNIKGMEKALEKITRANNLDKDDQDIPDASKIQPPVQLLQINFSFINSPFFKLIDEATKKAIFLLYDEFMSKVELSQLADYTDIWKVDETQRPAND